MIINNENDIKTLCAKVEHTVGREIRTPRDFEFLYKQIYELTHQTISVTTLKRVWGYTNRECGVSRFTLDVLSRLIGYSGWDVFSKNINGKGNGEEESSSYNIVVRRLFSKALNPGDKIQLSWYPNRKVEIIYGEQDTFVVTSSCNSKLMAGDQFQTPLFIDNQPLLLCNVKRDDLPPFDYRCGSIGGIIWKIIVKDQL